MGSLFAPRLVNGPFGDPGLFVGLRWEGAALLFDCGRIDGLPPGDLLRVTTVFVSHAHMDHFIGFDHMVRLLLARDQALGLFGPQGITDNVAGRLQGYTWNLVADYPFTVDVAEYARGRLRRTRFAARTGFRPEPLGEGLAAGGCVLDTSAYTVRAAELDHQIPCLGFLLAEKTRLNIRREALAAMGVPPGPWLSALKQAIREHEADDLPFVVRAHGRHAAGFGERTYPLGELRSRLVQETRGQRVAYVVDALFSPANVATILDLAHEADVLYCEAPFLEEDREQAARRYHLTARQAGALARAAGVRRLVVFHFSPRYQPRPGDPVAEAMAEYRGEKVCYADPLRSAEVAGRITEPASEPNLR